MSVCCSRVPCCFNLAPELIYFRPLAQGMVPVGRGQLLAMRHIHLFFNRNIENVISN